MHITISWGLYGSVAAGAAAVVIAGHGIRHAAQLKAMWRRLRGTDPTARCDSVLAALVQAAANRHEAQAIRRNVLAFVTDLTAAESASLLLFDRVRQRFVVRDVHGAAPGSFQVGDIAPFLQALRTRQRTVTRRHLVDDPVCADMKTVGLQYCIQYHAEACVPCFVGDELLAVINLGPRSGPRPYDTSLCTLLDRLALQCALLLQNADLLDMVQQHEREVTKVTELRNHFLANISHELRTPLTTVIGLTDHLLEQQAVTTPDELRHYLQLITQSGQRLLKTVTALVELAKLESGRETLEIRRVSLARLVDRVRTQLASHTLAAPSAIDVTLTDQMPPVYGDEHWLQCLFHHLLDNATKFAPTGRIWIDAARTGEMLKIGVHDSGPGIRPEHQEQIFRSFIQAENGAARPHEGTGVGLAISRRVVELHGGRLWLQSAHGHGSHFFFTLPLKPA